jgi:hypothetical protein
MVEVVALLEEATVFSCPVPEVLVVVVDQMELHQAEAPKVLLELLIKVSLVATPQAWSQITLLVEVEGLDR